ncbi:MAG: hypothetical protein EXR72_12900 [Myxococcales bacterium]|nr:hypothetical protein [Myxococcales bacterium]
MNRPPLPSSAAPSPGRIRLKSSHRRISLKTSHRRLKTAGDGALRVEEREGYIAPPKRFRR